jgi:hypothetical protein
MPERWRKGSSILNFKKLHKVMQYFHPKVYDYFLGGIPPV